MSWWCWWSWRWILPILEQIFNPSDVGRARQQRPVSMVSFSRRTGYMDEGIPNFDGFRCISRKVLKQNKKGAWVGIGWITEWKKLRDCAVYNIAWRSLLHSNLIRFNGRSCMEEAWWKLCDCNTAVWSSFDCDSFQLLRGKPFWLKLRDRFEFRNWYFQAWPLSAVQQCGIAVTGANRCLPSCKDVAKDMASARIKLKRCHEAWGTTFAFQIWAAGEATNSDKWQQVYSHYGMSCAAKESMRLVLQTLQNFGCWTHLVPGSQVSWNQLLFRLPLFGRSRPMLGLCQLRDWLSVRPESGPFQY